MATCPWAEEVDVPGGICTQHDIYKDLQPEFTAEIASSRKTEQYSKIPSESQYQSRAQREAGCWFLQTGPFL